MEKESCENCPEDCGRCPADYVSKSTNKLPPSHLKKIPEKNAALTTTPRGRSEEGAITRAVLTALLVLLLLMLLLIVVLKCQSRHLQHRPPPPLKKILQGKTE